MFREEMQRELVGGGDRFETGNGEQGVYLSYL